MTLLLKSGNIPVTHSRVSSSIGRRYGVRRGIVLLVAADAPAQSLVPAYDLATRQDAHVEFLCRLIDRGVDSIYTRVSGGFLPFMLSALPSDAIQYDLVVAQEHASFNGKPVSAYEFGSALLQLTTNLSKDSQWFVRVRVLDRTLASRVLEYAAECTSNRVNFVLALKDVSTE